MRDRADDNVFQAGFLDLMNATDREGYTVIEAIYAGPWHVVKRGGEYAVVQEAAGSTGRADATFTERETALLAAAVYPVLGRESGYHATSRAPKGHGFDIHTAFGGRAVRAGWLRYDHPELLETLFVAEYLLRSPAALAKVLEAADYETLLHAGRLLARRRRF